MHSLCNNSSILVYWTSLVDLLASHSQILCINFLHCFALDPLELNLVELVFNEDVSKFQENDKVRKGMIRCPTTICHNQKMMLLYSASREEKACLHGHTFMLNNIRHEYDDFYDHVDCFPK